MNFNSQATTFAGGGTLNFGTPIMGTTALITESMTGTVNLYATNATVGYSSTYSGGFTLTAGTLNFASAQSAGFFSAFTSDKLFTISGGTIDNTYGSALTLGLGSGSYSIGGDFTFTGSSDLSFGTAAVALTTNSQITASSHNLTIGGIISGSSFGLIKAGGGTVTLSGANTYTGTTTVSAGTLQLGNSLALQSSVLTIGNGTLSLRSDSDTTFSTGGTIAITSGTSPTIDVGHVTGGNLNHTLTLGNFKFNGTSTLNLTDTSADGYTAALGAGDLANTRSTINSSANSSFISLSASGATRTNTIFFTGTGTVTVGTINDDPGATAGNFEAVNMNNANGNLILTGASTYTGPTAIVAGTLTIGGAGQLGSGSYSANIGNAGAFTYNSSAAQILSGVISGIGTMTKSASGTLTLSGVNTYSGNTTISAGALALSGSGSIASSPLIAIATGSTLDVSAVTPSGFSLNGSGTLTLNINKAGATLTQGQLALGAKNLTYAGALIVGASGDTLALNDSFTLITTSGTKSSWFSSVSVPTLASGISWDTNKLATTGVLDIYTFTTTPLALSTPVNSNAVILVAKLANHASSSRGTPVAATATTPSHGTVSVDGSGNLTYSPTTSYSGSDSFTITFRDGHGWQTMAVSVTVGSGSGQSPNVVYGPTTLGGNFIVQFAGIPGTQYTVEKTTSLSPVNWTKLGNYTAPTDNSVGFGIGVFQVSDPVSNGSGYYRTVYPSY